VPPLPVKTAIGERPPIDEKGYAGLWPMSWSDFTADMVEDEVPDLRWPQSIRVYHRMRTDSQVDALTKSIFLPIRRRNWVIDPNSARDEVVEQVASDFGLPIKGTDEPPPRGRRRFNHDDHLRQALLATVYGHMFFEQVGEIDPELNWRMRKLAPRMPQSIERIKIDKQGGLEGIVQYGSQRKSGPAATVLGFGLPDPIPVKWLAAYVWDREGANWYGRSLLRPIYKNWLLKDRLMRIDAMVHEKWGLGIPQGKAPKGANERTITEYAETMKGVRANPDAGFGIPDGANLSVEGIKGSLPDRIASLRYHDEQMARDFLAMFMQLGTTESGSRALGITFADFFSLSVDATCDWYAAITSEYVIEDQVDWNFGVDEQCPLMAWEAKKDDPIDVSDLVALINKNIIVVDENLQAWARQNWDLPVPGGAEIQPPSTFEGQAGNLDNIPSNLQGNEGNLPAAARTRRGRWGSRRARSGI
jgi:hypothetical protein